MQNDKTRTGAPQEPEHKKSTPEYPLVVVKKLIHAPVEKVFAAWCREDMIKEWWGPEGYTCPYAKIEFRVGGKSLMAMRGPDGKDIYSTGTYLVIEPNKKIVTSDFFANSKGEIVTPTEAGMPPGMMPDEQNAFITIEFSAAGEGDTMLVISHEGLPKSMHDDCVKGWDSSLEKMKRLLHRH